MVLRPGKSEGSKNQDAGIEQGWDILADPDPRMPVVLDPESKESDMRTANGILAVAKALLGFVNPSSSGQRTDLACIPILTAGQCDNSSLS